VATNCGDYSATSAQVLLSQTPMQNSTQLSLSLLSLPRRAQLNSLTTPELDSPFSLLYSLRVDPTENTISNHNCCFRRVFTDALLRNRSDITLLFCCFLHVIFCRNITFTEPLLSNCRCLQNGCLAAGLYTTTVLWSFPCHTQSCRVHFL
jgi:hypothetical protein